MYARRLNNRQFSGGFTIVELLVVIVVIGILAAITIVSYSGITQRATVSSLQSDLANASTALKLDQINNDSFPATLALANGGKGITPSQTMDSTIYVQDNTSNPKNFCLMYRKGTNIYAVDNNSVPTNGVCLTNLITVGDFEIDSNSDGMADGWGVQGNGSDGAKSLTTDSYYGSKAQSITRLTGTYVLSKDISSLLTNGHKYYNSAMVKASVGLLVSWGFSGISYIVSPSGINVTYGNSTTASSSWNKLSGILTFASGQTVYLVGGANANGSVLVADSVILVDLTSTFGAGNEPTLAQMDTIMSNYNWFNTTAKANF